MPNTIKEIMSEFEKFYDNNPQEECNFCSGFGGNYNMLTTAPTFTPCKKCQNIHPRGTNYNVYEEFLKSSLLSLLDEVEKRLPKERVITNDDYYPAEDADYCKGDVSHAYNSYRKQVINILSSLRGDK